MKISTAPLEIREVAGLTVQQGPHGMSLRTTMAFAKGETLLGETRSQILVQEFPTIEDFEAALRSNDGVDASFLLQHSVPSVSGIVAKMSVSSPVSYLNHSHEPNVAAPYSYTDIDRKDRDPQDIFPIIALRDIEKGEYLTFDYNMCGAYDLRTDAPLIRFLELCAEHGEEKRPSQFQ